ncbi:MAG TPA: DUF3857 domain-containing protein, partial [Candidatus Limnocylindrales bacterium]|nr:DUF3857 domain-containing protein [Candidatus Limnocylindrales bacterium]
MSARLRWLTCVAIATLPFLPALSHAQSKSPKSGSSDPSQQAAIIEDVRTTVRFEDDGASQETMRQQVKIQSEAGLKEYGIITFGFIAGSQFSIDTVEVHKKDGTIVKAGPANTQEVTPEISRVAPMYSDIRQKQVTVPGLAIGDEVIFQYTTRRAALVPNQFWFQYSFAKTAIVLSESVEVNVPTARKLKMHCQPGYKPVISENGDRTIYQWHGSNDKIQDPEKLQREKQKAVLGGNAPPPSLELSTFESWAEIGAWYYGLEHDRATPSPQVKSKALELTKGLDTPEARVKALYQFVSSNFRYISLDFGIGRYQPHAADEVLANGYGDCKDKHTLLAALLQAVGIQAFPALISTNRQLEPEVPSPAQFDHLITAVPLGKELTFLDTTAEVAPFGMLLSPLRHKKALVVRGQTAADFVETPADPPFLAEEVFELNGKINDAGTLEAEVSYFLHGDTEVLFKNAFLQAPPAKYKDIVQFISYTGGFGGDVSNVKVDGLNAGDTGLRITYHYHRPDYFDFHDDPPRHSLPLAGSHLQKWGDDEDTVRLYTAPGEITYKCKVELPAGVTVQAPLPIKLNRDYAQYESSYSAEKNVLTGERRIKIVSPEVSGNHRQDYEALRRAVEADEGQEAVLRLPAGFAAKPGEVSANDLDELMQRAEIESRQREYADALADLHKVAEKDPKHKGVWTKMAMVEGYMRHYDQAIKDFEKAIQLDPYDAQAHAELGAAYLSIQKGGQAVDELKKSLEIDPLSHRAHYLLGWYYAIQKQDY